MDYGIYWLT